MNVSAAVVVATVRALRHHGGVPAEKLNSADPEAVKRGLGNLGKHIENVRTLGLAPVVTINKFQSDEQSEIQVIEQFCSSLNVPCAVSTVFENGGQGATELGEACRRSYRKRIPKSSSIPTRSLGGG